MLVSVKTDVINDAHSMWQTPYWLALGIWGGLVSLGSLAIAALMIFVPGSPHAGYMPRIFVFIMAGWGMNYGISQLREAMKERHSAKQPHSE